MYSSLLSSNWAKYNLAECWRGRIDARNESLQTHGWILMAPHELSMLWSEVLWQHQPAQGLRIYPCPNFSGQNLACERTACTTPAQGWGALSSLLNHTSARNPQPLYYDGIILNWWTEIQVLILCHISPSSLLLALLSQHHVIFMVSPMFIIIDYLMQSPHRF